MSNTTAPVVVVPAGTLPTVTIPTLDDGTANYTMRTRLDGRDFNLRFLWNDREGRWYLDIKSDAGVPLAMGIKLIANRPLLRFYQWDQRLPQGEMVAWDLTNNGGEPPGIFEMGPGNRVELSYHPVGF